MRRGFEEGVLQTSVGVVGGIRSRFGDGYLESPTVKKLRCLNLFCRLCLLLKIFSCLLCTKVSSTTEKDFYSVPYDVI